MKEYETFTNLIIMSKSAGESMLVPYKYLAAFLFEVKMMKYENLAGKKFGKLTAIKKIINFNTKEKHALWLCKCDCGNQKNVLSVHLKNGSVKSCGCLNHNQSNTRLYNIWAHIKNRCFNVTDKNYKYYGGRGITVCAEWLHDFQVFYDWAMSHGYADDLTIDRINVNGNYEPSNCRWVTRKEQCNNRRNNRLITYNGETHNLAEWALITGLKQNTLLYRIRRGWNVERVLSKR